MNTTTYSQTHTQTCCDSHYVGWHLNTCWTMQLPTYADNFPHRCSPPCFMENCENEGVVLTDSAVYGTVSLCFYHDAVCGERFDDSPCPVCEELMGPAWSQP